MWLSKNLVVDHPYSIEASDRNEGIQHESNSTKSHAEITMPDELGGRSDVFPSLVITMVMVMFLLLLCLSLFAGEGK